ncbi:hypothetical protein L873DRAFT_1507464 [Choiromyces venosus 120613-1]|uniref:Uncharacterized protein n=1 Tax=Choiromyces venosus 120613-1 TaxID=1336337 RepID=A0A3N4J6D2_9PEZI|nr:hypothetical protein L873DRAFT_1507464 [Choiromyces venosus 120613-1]
MVSFLFLSFPFIFFHFFSFLLPFYPAIYATYTYSFYHLPCVLEHIFLIFFFLIPEHFFFYLSVGPNYIL